MEVHEFDGSKLKEDPMPLLGKLANLSDLVLCNDAFLGTNMACSSGFPRLKTLKLSALSYLETWEAEGDAMPNLVVISDHYPEVLEIERRPCSNIFDDNTEAGCL